MSDDLQEYLLKFLYPAVASNSPNDMENLRNISEPHIIYLQQKYTYIQFPICVKFRFQWEKKRKLLLS